MGVFAAARDITVRKQLELALLQERDMAEKTIDIARVIILSLDLNGIITLINEKACEILGCSKEDAVGKDWVGYFIPERLETR